MYTDANEKFRSPFPGKSPLFPAEEGRRTKMKESLPGLLLCFAAVTVQKTEIVKTVPLDVAALSQRPAE